MVGAAGGPEAAQVKRTAGWCVTRPQVMNRIAQQPDRAGQYRQQQLDQAGGAKADRADRDRPVGCPPVPGIVADAREGETLRGITQPRGARMTTGLISGQIWCRSVVILCPGFDAFPDR